MPNMTKPKITTPNTIDNKNISSEDEINRGTKQFNIVERKQNLATPLQDDIAEERAVAMVYNGISHAVMMASPINLIDFAIGFSLTEGIIDNTQQIKGIDVVQSDLGYELQIEITNSPFMALKQRRRQLSGRSGCGICGLESLAAIKPKVKPVLATILPSFDIIAQTKIELNKHQLLRSKCGAVHSAAFVSNDGEQILLREDVGRHNALDKLLGVLNQNKEALNLSNQTGFIYISSRASYEMVFKTASQGYGTLVSDSAPTSMAIELAKKANMNLIGFIQLGRHLIYNEAKQ